MKPILKWEIDSIQAVIDEEKENLQGKVSETTVRIFTREKKPSFLIIQLNKYPAGALSAMMLIPSVQFDLMESTLFINFI